MFVAVILLLARSVEDDYDLEKSMGIVKKQKNR